MRDLSYVWFRNKLQLHYAVLTHFYPSCLPDKPRSITFKVEGASGNYVQENRTVTLKCHADAFPFALYNIYHNGPKVNNGSSGMYVISSMNAKHGVEYVC